MAKLYTPKTGVRIGNGRAIHFVRPGSKRTVCGVDVCEKCPTVDIIKVRAAEERWCKRCLGAMVVR